MQLIQLLLIVVCLVAHCNAWSDFAFRRVSEVHRQDVPVRRVDAHGAVPAPLLRSGSPAYGEKLTAEHCNDRMQSATTRNTSMPIV